MKTPRRILSMVLVLVMVLSLSVTAFAATTPSITVKVFGNTVDWGYTAVTGKSVEDVLNKNETLNVTIKWKSVADYYNPNKTHVALTYLRGYETVGFNPANTSDQEKLQGEGYNYQDIKWCTGNYQGYGLVNHDTTTGEYTYIYAGYDWTYKNESGDIWDYMCCHFFGANEAITLEYKFSVTDEWTTTTPIG